MKISTLAIAGIAALAAVAPAHAATYLVNYTGPGATASIRFKTANVLNTVGGYDILNASGNVNGDVLTGLIPNVNQPNPVGIPGFNIDNVFYTGDPVFSSWGLAASSATKSYNLWGNGPGNYSLYGYDGGYSLASDGGTLTVASVPEPASWALMIVGFGMVGFAARRRQVALAA